MSRRKIVVPALFVVAVVILLSSSTTWAILCQANADCNEKVDLSDLVIMRTDYMKNGCDPCMCNPNSDCPAGMVNCGGTCVDPIKDREYCGADVNCVGGTACGDGETCDGGVCILNCPTGMMECSGVCVDPMTDEVYCGSCTNSCLGGEICIGGSCEIYCSDNYAPVPKTGQTTKHADYDDGDLKKGVPWPNPRFTILYHYWNGAWHAPCDPPTVECENPASPLNDIVLDNLTKLQWMRDADWGNGTRTWADAVYLPVFYGYFIGNLPGWRLPNRFELESLLDMGYNGRALSNTAGTGQWHEGDPFVNVQAGYYWSSTTHAEDVEAAWEVQFQDGLVLLDGKSNGHYVWPVRSGDLY